MVLAHLGRRITRALQQLSEATIIDEEVLDEFLSEIARTLFQSDVQDNLVLHIQSRIKFIASIADRGGYNKLKIIEKAVFHELFMILNAGKPGFTPKKGEPSVVMFVGLQGSGKTTTCMKYAHYYQKKGWRPALVCANTFRGIRAGAFNQLKCRAAKANIPFYGSYTVSDHVKIAEEGVERFKKESCDLIIVDTSGGHKKVAALVEEMRQISEATKPDLVVFVMNSWIGQAAYDHAQAFKKSVGVGAVIMSKMDGHEKGGGALSAVAATKSPVIFIETGEGMDAFETFEVEPFVRRLLGMGDSIQKTDQEAELLKGKFTLRMMYDYYGSLLEKGAMYKIYSMMPGFTMDTAKIKRCVAVMHSMSMAELDSSNPNMLKESPSRLMRIARGSGRSVSDVMEVLQEHKRMVLLTNIMEECKIPESEQPRNINTGLPQQMLHQSTLIRSEG